MCLSASWENLPMNPSDPDEQERQPAAVRFNEGMLAPVELSAYNTPNEAR